MSKIKLFKIAIRTELWQNDFQECMQLVLTSESINFLTTENISGYLANVNTLYLRDPDTRLYMLEETEKVGQ